MLLWISNEQTRLATTEWFQWKYIYKLEERTQIQIRKAKQSLNFS